MNIRDYHIKKTYIMNKLKINEIQFNQLVEKVKIHYFIKSVIPFRYSGNLRLLKYIL
jgi:hypothetical protein